MTKRQAEYWSSHCLHSTYGANNNKEFYAEVLDESENEILTRCFPKQHMQEDTSWLRKCLIGSLYEVVEKPKEFIHTIKQLTIWEV